MYINEEQFALWSAAYHHSLTQQILLQQAQQVCYIKQAEYYPYNHQIPQNTPSYVPKKKTKFVSNFTIDAILSGTKVSDKSYNNKEMKPIPIPPHQFHLYSPQELEDNACKVEANKDGKYSCYLCTHAYSRRHQLKIHFRGHLGYKPLHCTYCDKTFSDQSNLNKHKKIHMKADESIKNARIHQMPQDLNRNYGLYY